MYPFPFSSAFPPEVTAIGHCYAWSRGASGRPKGGAGRRLRTGPASSIAPSRSPPGERCSAMAAFLFFFIFFFLPLFFIPHFALFRSAVQMKAGAGWPPRDHGSCWPGALLEILGLLLSDSGGRVRCSSWAWRPDRAAAVTQQLYPVALKIVLSFFMALKTSVMELCLVFYHLTSKQTHLISYTL